MTTPRKQTSKGSPQETDQAPDEVLPDEAPVPDEVPPEDEEVVTLVTPTEVQEEAISEEATQAWEDPNTYPDPETPLRSP